MTKAVTRMYLSRVLGIVFSLGYSMPTTLGFALLRRFPSPRIRKRATAVAATAITTTAILPHAARSTSTHFSSYSFTGGVAASIPLGWTRTARGGGGCSEVASGSLSVVSSSPASMTEPSVAQEGVGDFGGVDDKRPPVIFVLGGPGSGKGTQCQRLAKEYGYVHLSAGELLREERESESKDGRLIDEYIREGRIVPVNISLGLLQRAMEKGGPFSRFLIDGFPRNSDNVKGWNEMMSDVADVRCVLFLHCPEDVLEKRLLSRGESSGRTDDNAETARRRFRTYVETTLPVVEEFERKGMIARVNGDQEIDAVFRDVRAGLRPVQEREVLDANQAAVEALSKGDHKAYAEMCASDMTLATDDWRPANMPLDDIGEDEARPRVGLSAPFVRMLKGAAAVVVSEREAPSGETFGAGRGAGVGERDGSGGGRGSNTLQETRVWEVHDGRWKCVHCHSSFLLPPKR